MKTINILHVTDLHFGAPWHQPMICPKDKGISSQFGREISELDPKNRFIADVKRVLFNVKIDVIACTGDLGWEGEKTTVNKGARYLSKLAGQLEVSPDHVIVAPGNHDLMRSSTIGTELDGFEQECKNEGFIYAKRANPAVLSIKGIPIISLNTCLGGTEHALHGGLQDGYWEGERESLLQKQRTFEESQLSDQLGSDVAYQATAMDIPAIGFSQLDLCSDALLKGCGNCAVILMHHNPIPTVNVDVRPYANLIDSGVLISRLLENGKYIITLHGHTHCKAGITAYSHEGDQAGFLASIGTPRLDDAASLLELTVDDASNFINSSVSHIERNAATYANNFKYTLDTRITYSIEDIEEELKKIPVKVVHTIHEVANILGRDPDESLATDLLRVERLRVSITGKEQPHTNWRITRIR